MAKLDVGAYYMTEREGVVCVLGANADRVAVVGVEDRRHRTVGRAAFEAALASGTAQRVAPRWQPVGD